MSEKRVHVLQVTGGLGQGGLETVAMNIVRYMSPEKYSFDFLVFGDRKNYFEGEAVELGCNIIKIKKAGNIIAYYRQLVEVIKNNGPYDVVISHTFMNSGIVLKAAKKCHVKTCVAYAHSSDRGTKNAVKLITYKWLRNWLNRYSDLRIACSQKAGEYVYGIGKQFHVIGNGIDTEAYRFSQKTRDKVKGMIGIRDELVIGSVGRLSPEKNQIFLVYVLKELRELGTNAVLLLVGEGSAREKIEQTVRDNGLQDYVILTGARSDVPDLLCAMDVFLFPSLHEGLGICAIEAQASGLRTVCADTIPTEVGITDLASYKSLNDGPKSWAEEVRNYQQNSEREKYFKEVSDKGYSISECIKKLNDLIYLSIINK